MEIINKLRKFTLHDKCSSIIFYYTVFDDKILFLFYYDFFLHEV